MTWNQLTHRQKAALLELLDAHPNQVYAGRSWIAFRALASMGLAHSGREHNCFYLTIEGERLAKFGKQLSTKESKAARIERLYQEAMESPDA